MTKNPLAVIILLAFVIGGAAAVVLNYPPRHVVVDDDAGKTVATQPAAATHVAEAEHVEEEEGAASDGLGDSASSPSALSVEAEDGAGKSSGVMSRRRAADEPSVQSPRTSRHYARASGRRPANGVTAATVGGVKKTGQGMKKAGTTIGRTFGRLGGAFNE